MLTNRVFLIYWGGPDKLENFLQPNKISWTYNEKLFQGSKMHESNWGGTPSKILEWVEKENFHIFLKQDVEAVGTLSYFAPHIWKNPHHSQRAEELGLPRPVQSDFPYAMIGCAMEFLFKKSAFVEDKLTQARKNLAARPYIGIHLRTSDTPFGVDIADRVKTKNPENVIKCAQRVETLIQANKSVEKRPVTWFLAADDVKIKKKWMKRFPSKLFSLRMTPQHIDISKVDTTGIRDALVDIFLLSESDYFISSLHSSFSYVAIGIKGFSVKSFTYGERCHINGTLELAV